MRPPKPATSTPEQIALLRRRGINLDERHAAQWLTNVSYYRLSAYWYPARRQDDRGKRDDSFVEGAAFVDVTALYEADRKLRTLIHDGMERVEITMRTRIGELLCVDDPSAMRIPPGSVRASGTLRGLGPRRSGSRAQHVTTRPYSTTAMNTARAIPSGS